jgi:hypothetical protein
MPAFLLLQIFHAVGDSQRLNSRIQYFPAGQCYFSLKILVFNKETIQITDFEEYVQACFGIPFPVSLSLTLHAFK